MNVEPAPGPVDPMMDPPELLVGAKARGPRRIFLESLLIVGAVGTLAGGLVWLRRQGGPAIDPQQRQALMGPDLVEALPSPMATQAAAVAPPETQPLNTPHPEAPPVVEVPAGLAAPAADPGADAQEAQDPPDAAAQGSAKQVVHEIKSGDTLYGIAIDYGVTLDDLYAANNVTDPTGFHVGDKLIIPNSGDAAAAAPAAAAAGGAVTAPTPDLSQPQPIVVRAQEVYRVQPGDSLDDVASKHNVSSKDLKAFNPGLGDGAELKAGQELVIRPAQLATATALPDGTAIPAPGQPALAADAGADLLPALRLLSPGGEMTVADEVLLLRWSSAGILPEGLYYVVSLRDITTALAKGPEALANLPPLEQDPDARREWVYSNATALRVPPELRPALGAKRVIEWSVTVRQDGSKGLEGIRSDAAGREIRRFTWQPGAAAEETE